MREPSTLLALTQQLDWWWRAIFRRRLDGLTDDEFMWQPDPNGWTIHPIDGGVRVDHEWPPPEPAPVTTIGWRMCHIGVGCLAQRTNALFPDALPRPWSVETFATQVPFPSTADAAIDFLDEWWAAWRHGLDAAGENGLWEPIADAEGGLYANNDFAAMFLARDDPRLNLILHVHRELMHHGAEICLLRDLYAVHSAS